MCVDSLVIHASYLGDVVSNPAGLLLKASEVLSNVDYDTIVATGLSGALFAPTLAHTFRKKLLLIRKPESTHSSRPVEGELGKRWLFVDDLIASGSTLRTVHSKVVALGTSTWAPSGFQTEFVGAFLYAGLLDDDSPMGSATSPGYHAAEALAGFLRL